VWTFLHWLGLFLLPILKGKGKKLCSLQRMCEIYKWKSIFVPCTNMADTVFVPRNRRWLFSQGTDSISNFTSSFYNPVGLTSQEGLLYNPRQRFETVRRLSRQETRRASNHRRDTKDRSLAHGQMASKTLKNRYLSCSYACTINFTIIFYELWFSRDWNSP